MPKKKIANKTVSRFSIWREWYDVVEEEMLAFLGLIINMGVIHLPYVKDCWSQQFVCRVPFFGEVFTRIRFLQILWMLHLVTVSTSDHSLRTRTQKVSNFLKYLDARFFWSFEVSIINAYILCMKSCRNSNSNPISHKVQEEASDGPCWGFPSRWWCIHER
jgi:hypothetical protein